MSAIDHKSTVSEATGQAQPWQLSDLVGALLSQSARDVVWHWISERQFLDDDNQPRALYPGNFEGAGFNSLIGLVNPHFVPAIIRNELLRKGIVEQDNDCLLLRRIAYVSGAALTTPL